MQVQPEQRPMRMAMSLSTYIPDVILDPRHHLSLSQRGMFCKAPCEHSCGVKPGVPRRSLSVLLVFLRLGRVVLSLCAALPPTVDSICLRCFPTVSRGEIDAVRMQREDSHACNPHDLERFEGSKALVKSVEGEATGGSLR
jgi:hypothetical protein